MFTLIWKLIHSVHRFLSKYCHFAKIITQIVSLAYFFLVGIQREIRRGMQTKCANVIAKHTTAVKPHGSWKKYLIKLRNCLGFSFVLVLSISTFVNSISWSIHLLWEQKDAQTLINWKWISIESKSVCRHDEIKTRKKSSF